MSEMLFDTSPEEVEQSGRKKPRARKQEEPTVAAPAESRGFPAEARFLASLNGHYACRECGATSLDLVEERWIDGQRQWLVQCGWNCLTSWLVDPIPGILDKEDARQKAAGKAFVVKGGRFDGMTFDDIAAAGCRWYIAGVAEKGRPYLAAAAKEWLSSNGG